MNDDTVIASPAKFSEGVEAGLNSSDGTRDGQAKNGCGQELHHESENKKSEQSDRDFSIPLFMRGSGSKKSSDQDEKDGSAE